MTIMHVTLTGTTLDAKRKQRLASRLIDAFARIEVGQSTPAVRAGFVVRIDEVEPENLWMGDAKMSDASPAGRAAIVNARVMGGPWSDAMKAELFVEIEDAVRDVAEMRRAANGTDFWMTIVEVPDGGWGLGGKPVSIGKLAPAFEEERQQRIEKYLRDREKR